jgi:hypothetical protein
MSGILEDRYYLILAAASAAAPTPGDECFSPQQARLLQLELCLSHDSGITELGKLHQLVRHTDRADGEAGCCARVIAACTASRNATNAA